jgi:succinate dehydrogenase / fumarate reductase membrane anchor subunit
MGYGKPIPARGFERSAWLFMRLSGLLLIFLAVGHLAIMHLIHSVEEVNYAFVAERFTTPFWRGYDLLMLWLAMAHGTNGLRTILDDYVHAPAWNRIVKSGLYLLVTTLLVMGTLVLFTFKPVT